MAGLLDSHNDRLAYLAVQGYGPADQQTGHITVEDVITSARPAGQGRALALVAQKWFLYDGGCLHSVSCFDLQGDVVI